MSAEFPTLAEVLRQHRLVTYFDKSSGCSTWVGSWTTRHRCDCGWTSTEPDCTRTDHPEHVADAWREACTIRTVEQLDALPPQTVIQSDPAVTGDDNPWTWERFDEDWFTTAFDPPGIPDLPALLLWHPDWSEGV